MDEKKVHKKLDDHVIRYFIRVQEVTQDDSFDDPESKELFFRNVLNEIETDFVRLAKNWKVSRILEDLLPKFSSEEHLGRLFKIACESTPSIISNQFGSHVLQKVFRTFPKQNLAHNNENENSLAKVFLVMVETCILENEPTLIRDLYGSHVLSEIIQLLGGVTVDQKISRSRASMNYQKRHKLGEHFLTGEVVLKDNQELPKECKTLLGQIIHNIMECSNFGELLCNQSANPVLQILLLVTNKRLPKLCKALSTKMLKKGNLLIEDSQSHSQASSTLLLLDAVGSHLVEKLLLVMSQKQIKQFYKDCLADNLISLSLHHIGNFSVQTFLKVCQSKEVVEATISALCSSMSEILQNGFMQVIVQMANAAANLCTGQLEFLSSLYSLEQLQRDKSRQVGVLRQLLCLTKDIGQSEGQEEKAKEEELKTKDICYHGCTLVSHLLRFEKNRKIVRCFFDLKDRELLSLCCHPHGSIVMEGLFQSEQVKAKSKAKFSSFFMENIRVVSCDKFGSHVVDKFWRQLSMEKKEGLVQQFVRYETDIRKSFFGKFVLQNCHISIYKESQDRWRKMQAEYMDRGVSVQKEEDTLLSTVKSHSAHPEGTSKEDTVHMKRKRRKEARQSGSRKGKKHKRDQGENS